MQKKASKKKFRNWFLSGLALVFITSLVLLLVAQRYVEPLLKARLHTLIIHGSDSLYTYTLGSLEASFLGGSVEVQNLHVAIDTARYRQMQAAKNLPSLTLELDLIKGKIQGIAILPLLFSKKITIDEIISEDANIRLIRQGASNNKKQKSKPLWKSIQPEINRISIDKINLDGVKFLYRNADTAESLKLQFDTCYAIFKDIIIDSAATADTERFGFAKEMSMRFRDLKFRSADSTMKLKAEIITYSSASKTLTISDFKMQPTLKAKNDFYAVFRAQKAMNVVEFSNATLTNFRLDQFVQNNLISANSLLLTQPFISIYVDKTQPALNQNKMGTYPHQKLLAASTAIQLKGIKVHNGKMEYTERGAVSKKEGTLSLSNLFININNVTNDSLWILKNPVSTATVRGNILDKSPLNLLFSFRLDSANGSFAAEGTVTDVSAEQLNQIAVPLGNARLQSFNLQHMSFSLTGNDFGTAGKVRLRYNNLFVILSKIDKETGQIAPNKFLTKVVNKYTLKASNPGADGVERIAMNVRRARPTSQAFFGLIWKTIFTGMQQVMMGSGTYP